MNMCVQSLDVRVCELTARVDDEKEKTRVADVRAGVCETNLEKMNEVVGEREKKIQEQKEGMDLYVKTTEEKMNDEKEKHKRDVLLCEHRARIEACTQLRAVHDNIRALSRLFVSDINNSKKDDKIIDSANNDVCVCGVDSEKKVCDSTDGNNNSNDDGDESMRRSSALHSSLCTHSQCLVSSLRTQITDTHARTSTHITQLQDRIQTHVNAFKTICSTRATECKKRVFELNEIMKTPQTLCTDSNERINNARIHINALTTSDMMMKKEYKYACVSLSSSSSSSPSVPSSPQKSTTKSKTSLSCDIVNDDDINTRCERVINSNDDDKSCVRVHVKIKMHDIFDEKNSDDNSVRDNVEKIHAVVDDKIVDVVDSVNKSENIDHTQTSAKISADIDRVDVGDDSKINENVEYTYTCAYCDQNSSRDEKADDANSNGSSARACVHVCLRRIIHALSVWQTCARVL
jgi:hypothetical protein